jgi:hypothetical protein
VTPDEVPAFLRTLQGAAMNAASPAANAMGERMEREVHFQLKLAAHPPGQFYRAPREASPAFASGHLDTSMFHTTAFSRVRATSVVGNTAIYAAVQEFGAIQWPSNHKFMHWRNTGGEFWMRRVTIPEHPYFKPALKRIISNGSLRESALDAFKRSMPPFIR